MVPELTAIGAFIQQNGLALFVLLAFGYLILTGKLRTGNGADRELAQKDAAIKREREVSDEKQAIITSMIVEMKDHAIALNHVSDSIDERNRIEREMRGRRA